MSVTAKFEQSGCGLLATTTRILRHENKADGAADRVDPRHGPGNVNRNLFTRGLISPDDPQAHVHANFVGRSPRRFGMTASHNREERGSEPAHGSGPYFGRLQSTP